MKAQRYIFEPKLLFCETIFDNIGRKVMTVENNNMVNVSELTVGVYMVKVHTDVGIRTVKIVKQ